jgi:hypothetical protein
LPASSDTDAFTASDNIQDFNLAEGDALDISDILSGYDPRTDAITDFVQIAYLYNITGLTDEESLETNGVLVTV